MSTPTRASTCRPPSSQAAVLQPNFKVLSENLRKAAVMRIELVRDARFLASEAKTVGCRCLGPARPAKHKIVRAAQSANNVVANRVKCDAFGGREHLGWSLPRDLRAPRTHVCGASIPANPPSPASPLLGSYPPMVVDNPTLRAAFFAMTSMRSSFSAMSNLRSSFTSIMFVLAWRQNRDLDFVMLAGVYRRATG
ncbi:hypothetical protein ACVWXL_000143 [Bradyrhizobium sp. GM22.5]